MSKLENRRGFSCIYKSTISKIPECQGNGCKTKQEKLGAEKRNRFIQIPNAKEIPMKRELAMKLLRNIGTDHTMAKFNFNQTMTMVPWTACIKTDLDHKLF